MITLISGLLGLFGSAIPELFKALTSYQDKKHELAMFDKQVKLSETGYKYQLDTANVQADTSELQTLYTSQKPSNIVWVDAVNQTVRPFVTYTLIMFYVAFKTAVFFVMTSTQIGLTSAEAVIRLWNEDDMSLLSLVIGFWFGHRMLQKYRNK